MAAFSNIIELFNYLLSFIMVRPVRRYRSEYNGELSVQLVNGNKVLDTPRANYSFGGLYDAFDRLFRDLHFADRKFDKILILGLGAGSIVSLLRKKYHCNSPVTGVEIDPLVLRIAEHHFELGSWANLEVVCMDAVEFMEQNHTLYNLIIVDLYIDVDVPPQFESGDFITLLFHSRSPGGMIIFNKLAYDEPTNGSAIRLIERFRIHDPATRVISQKRNHTINFMLVSTN